MKCEQIKACLSSYYDDELDAWLVSEVEKHLPGCDECQCELRSFEQLSQCLAADVSAKPADDGWENICSRLDRLDRSCPVPITAPRVWAAPSRFQLTVAALAMAASLMTVAVLRTPPDQNIVTVTQASAPLDLSEIVDLAAREPALALDAMAKRFQGQAVNAEEAEALLGYRPALVRSLPAETRLVSTQVLMLPNCECEAGKCTCGPSGCNCAACLCKRKDGSEFLVLEHCRSQNISFGKFATQSLERDAGNLQLFGGADRLAASWIAQNRRLTAIGLKNVAEAQLLSATSDVALNLN